MVTKSYDLDKTVGGEDTSSVYAIQDGEYSNEILTRVVEYTLTIGATSYTSLSDPTSDLEWNVNDVVDVYADATGNEYAYLASGQILKGKTTYSVTSYTISAITHNNVSKSKLVEKDIDNEDVVVITLIAVQNGGQ